MILYFLDKIFPRIRNYYQTDLNLLKKIVAEKQRTIKLLETSESEVRSRLESLSLILRNHSNTNVMLDFIDDQLLIDLKDSEMLLIYSREEEVKYRKIGHINYRLRFDNTMYIEDIQLLVYNKGYGTIGLNYLKKVANKKNIERITGSLSWFDYNDHGDRLLHFYKKNQFKITETNNSSSSDFAKIEYNLIDVQTKLQHV